MPVNVQLTDANFSLGPEVGFFYSFSNSLKSLLQVEADGDVVATFPIAGALVRNPVKQLHYDGTFFWTLEDLPSELGMVIKRWRLTPVPSFSFPSVTPISFTWQDEITLINGPTIRWDAEGFAVEHYHRTLTFSAARGDNSIVLNSVANIAVGDRLYIGPSSLGGSESQEEFIIVSTIDETLKTITFTKTGGLQSSYTASDPVDFVKSVFLFNNHSFSGLEDERGSLVRFSWPKKNVILSDQGSSYFNVNAADFDSTILGWVRGSQIFEINLTDIFFDIFRSLEANLFEANQADIITVYDLIYDFGSNVYFKLQQKETTESISTGTFSTVDFSPDHNFQTQTTIPVVNSTAISFPQGRFTLPFSSGETLPVRVEVRDQFNFPVLGETVQFSATLNALSPPGSPGTFSSPTVITNTSGIAETVYTPSSTNNANLIVDIQAKVL